MKVALSLLVFISLFSTVNANAQWQSSQSSCYAYTDCYGLNAYGQTVVTGRISCQVYGSTYAFGPSATSNSCSWYTSPGRAVQCSGFAQVRDVYGNYIWGWQNYSYRCY